MARSTKAKTEREAKYTKESEQWLSQTSTSNRYTALLEEESEDQQQKAGPVNTPKPPPIYTTDVKNKSPFIQLLEQTAKQQYEIKALADNLDNVQPNTCESYREIVKALDEKCTQFHICKLKEETSYRVVLKTYALLHQPSRNKK
jgi:hypothetical protein